MPQNGVSSFWFGTGLIAGGLVASLTTQTTTDSQSISSGVNTDLASDGYVDNDTGMIAVTDSTTTSFDTYVMYDVHYISGSKAGSIELLRPVVQLVGRRRER